MPECQGDRCPVSGLSWWEALAYANLLSERSGLPPCYELFNCVGDPGRTTAPQQGMVCEHAVGTTENLYDCPGYRLPTELEWEYAIRAGTRTAFYSGDITPQIGTTSCGPDPILEEIAWYCHNTEGPHPVGELRPNGWGLYDMSGNLAEWLANKDYGIRAWTSPVLDPKATLPDTRAVEGGLDNIMVRGGSFLVWSGLCRSAANSTGPEDRQIPSQGLRLVQTLESSPSEDP